MARRRVMKARGRSVLAKFSVPLTWRYGRDLTDAARRGQLDPVIGRDEELARLIQILGRKTKNNPVLIGKSGVGKTAIVEGLALRIAEGMVPPVLLGKRLVSLDLATMLAGARIRGEFGERLKSALTLLSTSKGEFVLEELARKRAEAAQYERAGDLARAADIEYGQIGELDRRLEAATKGLADLQADGGMIKSEVDTQEVAAVVSAWTGVPVARLMEGEAAKLIQMEDVIRRRVVGQDEAVRAVSGPIRRSRAGLSDENRPIGTFLFLGPTGVGKTELARALAEFLFDNDHAMVRIDMGEYQERHTVARLIGAPPGYIGFHEGGQLTEAVHRRPYAVVLLDEIEKAHPDVFNTLLQLLDDGRLTDGHGRTVDFTNTVLIMTSNLREDPKDFFKPEFINRIDEIVRFRSLTPDNLSQIVRIQLRQLAGRAEGVGIKLEVDQAAEAWLAARGYDPEYGARPLRRVLQRELSDRLAVLLLDGTFHAGDTVLTGVANDQLSFH